VDWLRDEASFTVIDGTFNIAAIPTLIRQVLRTEVERMMPVSSHGLSFARCSTATVDSGVRIHSDQGMGASHAWVWYSQDTPQDSDNGTCYGTAFFTHETWGDRFSGTAAEHDRLLAEESMDESRWRVQQVVPMQRNRLAVYPADLFHSRYPHDGWGTSSRDGRVVIVGFCSEGDRG
jgi:hypothetical protein